MTAEQKARDMLERMGVEDAQSFSAGDLVELANLIACTEHAPTRDLGAPVAEVVCYEMPRYMKPPLQTYELRQFDGFRALPPGTHQLYTAPKKPNVPVKPPPSGGRP